jgi:hypothetical protein
MPIGFRVGIILVCAYAGWQTASVQFGELPEPQQRTYQAGVDVRRESAHVRLLYIISLRVETRSPPYVFN